MRVVGVSASSIPWYVHTYLSWGNKFIPPQKLQAMHAKQELDVALDSFTIKLKRRICFAMHPVESKKDTTSKLVPWKLPSSFDPTVPVHLARIIAEGCRDIKTQFCPANSKAYSKPCLITNLARNWLSSKHREGTICHITGDKSYDPVVADAKMFP